MTNRIIWKGALARTGGSLCLAVAEELLRAGERPFANLPFADLERLDRTAGSLDQAEAVLKSVYPGLRCGGQEGFFSPLFLAAPFRVLFVRRDPRDALRSYRRLTRCSFVDSLAFLRNFMQLHELFGRLPASRCLTLDYRADVLDPPRLVAKIAAFIGTPAPPETGAAIAGKLSPTAVRSALAADAARSLDRLLAMPAAPSGGSVALTLLHDGRRHGLTLPLSAFDPATRRAMAAGRVSEWGVSPGDGSRVWLASNKDGRSVRILRSDRAAPYLRHFNAEHLSRAGSGGEAPPFDPAEAREIERRTAPFLDRHGFAD